MDELPPRRERDFIFTHLTENAELMEIRRRVRRERLRKAKADSRETILNEKK